MIEVKDLGKKYNRRWIFRHLDVTIPKGSVVALTGNNGAGKSTLLQIISGYLSPSEGQVMYEGQRERLLNTVFIGPYTEVIEEYTLREFLHFYGSFKKPLEDFREMAKKAQLPLDQSISDFSTGMKQRTKLLTAFYYQSDLICMDEPTANLDENGFSWWSTELKSLESRTVIIASNQKEEIRLCSEMVNLKKIDT